MRIGHSVLPSFAAGNPNREGEAPAEPTISKVPRLSRSFALPNLELLTLSFPVAPGAASVAAAKAKNVAVHRGHVEPSAGAGEVADLVALQVGLRRMRAAAGIPSLRRDPDELREVLRSRGFDERKVAENVAAEILDVCLFDAIEAYGEKKVCEINISNRGEEEVADEVMQIIEGKKECKVGRVDWLTKLELSGRLEEFLNDL